MTSIPPTSSTHLAATSLGETGSADHVATPSSALQLFLEVVSALPRSNVSDKISQNIRMHLDALELDADVSTPDRPKSPTEPESKERKIAAEDDGPAVPSPTVTPSTLLRTGAIGKAGLTASADPVLDALPVLPPSTDIKPLDKKIIGDLLMRLEKSKSQFFEPHSLFDAAFLPLGLALRYFITKLYEKAHNEWESTPIERLHVCKAINMGDSESFSLQKWIEQTQEPILNANKLTCACHGKAGYIDFFKWINWLAKNYPQYSHVPIYEFLPSADKPEGIAKSLIDFACTGRAISLLYESCLKEINVYQHIHKGVTKFKQEHKASGGRLAPGKGRILQTRMQERLLMFLERQARSILPIETRIQKLTNLLRMMAKSSEFPQAPELIQSVADEILMLERLFNNIIRELDLFDTYISLLGLMRPPETFHSNLSANIQFWIEKSNQNFADLIDDINREIQHTVAELQTEANWTPEELSAQCQFVPEDWRAFIERLYRLIGEQIIREPLDFDKIDKPSNFSTLSPLLKHLHSRLITLCRPAFEIYTIKTEKLIRKLKPESVDLHTSGELFWAQSQLVEAFTPLLREHMLILCLKSCNLSQFKIRLDQLSQALIKKESSEAVYQALLDIRTAALDESGDHIIGALIGKQVPNRVRKPPTQPKSNLPPAVVRIQNDLPPEFIHGIDQLTARMHCFVEPQMQLLRRVILPAMQAYLTAWKPPAPGSGSVEDLYSDWEDPIPTLLKRSKKPLEKSEKEAEGKAVVEAPKMAKTTLKPAKKASLTTKTSAPPVTGGSSPSPALTDTDTGFDFSRQLLAAYKMRDLPPWSSRISISRPVSTCYDHVYGARLSSSFAKLPQIPMPEAMRKVLCFGSLHSNAVAQEAAITAAIFRTSPAGASRKLPHGLIALANRLGIPLRPEWHSIEDLVNWIHQPHSRPKDHPVCKLAQRLHLPDCESDSKIFADQATFFKASVLNQCAALATHSTEHAVLADIQAKVSAAGGPPICGLSSAHPHLAIKPEQQALLKLAITQLSSTQAKLQAFLTSHATVLSADQQNYINDLIGQCHSMAWIIAAVRDLPIEEFLLCYFWQFMVTAQTSVISIGEYLGESIADEVHGTLTKYIKTRDSKTRHSFGTWNDFCDIAEGLLLPQKRVFNHLDIGKGGSYPHRFSTYSEISSSYLDHLMALSQLEAGGFTRHRAEATKALDPDHMLKLTITYMSEIVSLLEHLASKRILF